MNLQSGDRISLRRDIVRHEGPYASIGDQGTILSIFRPIPTALMETKPLSAKVQMDDGPIKTFRLTSLKKIKP